MQQYLPFTVLKRHSHKCLRLQSRLLQQYLPFTVLKRYINNDLISTDIELQQYLPFMVLKLSGWVKSATKFVGVATVLTVYGIETILVQNLRRQSLIVATVLTVYGIETKVGHVFNGVLISCNSTYRLRY